MATAISLSIATAMKNGARLPPIAKAITRGETWKMSRQGSVRKFAQLAKDVRSELGLTQQQFAKRLGIKQSSLSNIERGRTKVVKSTTWISMGKALRDLPLNKRPDIGDMSWAEEPPGDQDEHEFLSIFRRIPPARREMAKRLLEALIEAAS